MNQQVKDVVRYWIPELVVFGVIGAGVGAALSLWGVDLTPTVVVALCVFAILNQPVSAVVRKVMTPKPKKNDT